MGDDVQDVHTVEVRQNDAAQVAVAPADTPPQADNRLVQVKQEALRALVPIMDNLQEDDPERKFDMCMNAMRLTDDKNLAETALKAALAIQDAGTKAEALVELITEIDYQLQSAGQSIAPKG